MEILLLNEKKFWSWTLVISSPFRSDVDKFKLKTQIKTLKNIADEKQVGIKEAKKIISLNASQKLLVSEVLMLVNLVLLVPPHILVYPLRRN